MQIAVVVRFALQTNLDWQEKESANWVSFYYGVGE